MYGRGFVAGIDARVFGDQPRRFARDVEFVEVAFQRSPEDLEDRLGAVVGRLQRFLRRIPPDDMRLMLFPLLVNLCFSVLVSDSDNLLFSAIKDGLLPAIVVRLGSRVEPWKPETIEDSSPIPDSAEPSPVPARG